MSTNKELKPEKHDEVAPLDLEQVRDGFRELRINALFHAENGKDEFRLMALSFLTGSDSVFTKNEIYKGTMMDVINYFIGLAKEHKLFHRNKLKV